MQPVLDIALVGVGRWGSNLLRVLTQMPHVRVRSVCDKDASRLDACRGLPGLGQPILTRDAVEVMQLSGLRAIVIATPPESHVSLGLRALARGLDVFVEKPLGPSAAEARLMVDEAEQRGSILMVGHILEYHPHLQALYRVSRSGILGPILRLECERHGCISDDAWWALAPHDLGLALKFLGEARSLTAESLRDGVLAVSIRMQRGEALIRVSRNSEPKIRRIGVIGRDATAVFDDSSTARLSIQPSGLAAPVLHHATVLNAARTQAALGPEPLRAELESFVDAILSRHSPVADGHYGLNVVALLEAADRSLAAGSVRISCHTALHTAGRAARGAAPTLEPAASDG